MRKEFDRKALPDELGLLTQAAQSAICTHPECQAIHVNSLPCHWDDAEGHASFKFKWYFAITGGQKKRGA